VIESIRQLRHENLAIVLMLLTVVLSPAQAAQYDGKKDFDIDVQSLGSALIKFSEQADLQVLISTELIEDLKSERVKGRYLPEVALAMLIAGTDLTFHAIGNDTIAVSSETRDLPGSPNVTKDRPVNHPAANDCTETSIDSTDPAKQVIADCEG